VALVVFCMCQWNAWYLKSGMMTAGVEDYLLWHWFGNVCTLISLILMFITSVCVFVHAFYKV